MSSNDTDALSENIHTNYNAVGAAIIQRLFGDGYLSPCGEAATEQLAHLAAPSSTSRVLDVGSGLGGAAMWLAENVGCQITGLDLVASNVHAATNTAESRGLTDLVRFRIGDATAMAFEDDSFSMVWGQDAWCHVPNRDALFAECARVLEPGGTIAFADWLLTGDEDESYRQGLLPSMACPSYETLSGYEGLLEGHGFTDITAEDLSEQYASHYKTAMTRLEEAKDWITEKYGARVFAIVLEKNGFALEAFDKNQIGGGHFRARAGGS